MNFRIFLLAMEAARTSECFRLIIYWSSSTIGDQEIQARIQTLYEQSQKPATRKEHRQVARTRFVGFGTCLYVRVYGVYVWPTPTPSCDFAWVPVGVGASLPGVWVPSCLFWGRAWYVCGTAQTPKSLWCVLVCPRACMLRTYVRLCVTVWQVGIFMRLRRCMVYAPITACICTMRPVLFFCVARACVCGECEPVGVQYAHVFACMWYESRRVRLLM